MTKRPALGRGLAALLGENTSVVELAHDSKVAPGSSGDKLGTQARVAASNERQPVDSGSGVIVDLQVALIKRNPRQPRRVFDPEALNELAKSIESVGIVQPVIVRQAEEGYELIAGERRWRAAQMAGYTVIPAIIREASDVESLELALIENVVRQQLNPVDEAFALKVLLEDLGVTQENLAAQVGRSRSAIANKIRLLDLPAPIQEFLVAGTITEGHGRALLGLSERSKQLQLARRIISKELSVRQVEEEVRKLTAAKNTNAELQENAEVSSIILDAALLEDVQQAFLSLLGIMPRIKTKGSSGVIELRFKDADELYKILDNLGNDDR